MTAQPRRHRRSWIYVAVLLILVGALATPPTATATLDLTPIEVKADPDVSEVVPAGNDEIISWAQNSEAHPDHYDVYIQWQGQERIKVNRRGTHGNGGGFYGTSFVYSEWKPDGWGSQIVSYDVIHGTRHTYGRSVNTDMNEFHPTLAGRWLLFTRHDYNRDTWRVVLHNTYTRATRVLASGQGNDWVYAGQVNGNYATWGRVRNHRQDVYRYNIRLRRTTVVPQDGFVYQYNPAIAPDGTLYYSRGGDGCGVAVEIVRHPIGEPPEVLRALPAYVDTGYSYVYDRYEEGRDLYYATLDCRLPSRRRWDTFRLADSATLTTSLAGAGAGEVTSAPDGIECGSDCTAPYARGTQVTLTARPFSGSEVGGWSAPECPTATLTCTITVTEDRNVTVTFDPAGP